MDVEIRPITEDERLDWLRAADTAFSNVSKDDELEAFLPVIEVDRCVRGRRRQPDRRHIRLDHVPDDGSGRSEDPDGGRHDGGRAPDASSTRDQHADDGRDPRASSGQG